MEAINQMNMMDLNIWISAFYLVLFAALALLAFANGENDRRWWLLAIGLGGVVVVGSLFKGLAHAIITDLGAFLAVGLVWFNGDSQARKAAKSYFWLMVVAVACMIGGLFLVESGGRVLAGSINSLAIWILVVGFGIKLALIPFYFWLPRVAQAAPALTTAMIVALVDMASFNGLWELRESSPWVFESHYGLWLSIALLSMLGGAILAFAQRDIKRMLAFSTIDDLGYLLLGVLAGSQIGMSGALIGALSHSLMKVLLFGSISVVEKQLGNTITLDDRGLASRFPVSGAAFIIGALGMVGVPPTLGFLGRWRLYLTGSQMGGMLLVGVMVVATGLALLYYVRAIHSVWLGSSSQSLHGAEPRIAALVLVVLSVLAVVSGIYPGFWTVLLPQQRRWLWIGESEP